jgi:hypothetical protein
MRKKGIVAAVAAFASSPQGRKMMRQAKDYATSPEGKRKLNELRDRASRKRPQ